MNKPFQQLANKPKKRKSLDEPPQSDIALYNIKQVTNEMSNVCPQPLPIQSPSQVPISLYTQYLQCFIDCWRSLFNDANDDSLQDPDVTQFISRYRNSRAKTQVVLPPSSSKNKPTLVLDLDYTLIASSLTEPKNYDFVIELEAQKPLFCVKRFGVDSFLFELSQYYEIVVFSEAKREYVDAVLDQIDSKKTWISHRLYKQHCLNLNGCHFIKNLKTLGRPLNRTILVDDSAMAGALQPGNLYKVPTFDPSQKSVILLKLTRILKQALKEENFVPVSQILSKYDPEAAGRKAKKLRQASRQYRHSKKSSGNLSQVSTVALNLQGVKSLDM